MEALLRDALEMMNPLAIDRGLHLEARAEPPDLCAICDRDRVLQVLSNLIGNALKFTPSGGTVTVRAEPGDGEVMISVTDTGPGIAPEQLRRIFDRYWQGKNNRAAGVGLGLSIVKGLVESHGGNVFVKSQEGSGSTFAFTLPAEPASTSAAAEPAQTEGAGAPKILVVDDDEDIRDSIQQALEDNGYRVVTARNGFEALNLLRAGERPSVILLDVMMPVMDGATFREEQRRDPELGAIPVVAFSAYADLSDAVGRLNAEAHLTKPVRSDVLLDTLGRCAAAQRSRP